MRPNGPCPERAERVEGFTLVELLVVVAIIALLAGILLPVAMRVRLQGQIATTRGTVRDLDQAMAGYKEDCGAFPDDHDSAGPSFLYYLLESGLRCPYIDKSKIEVGGTGTGPEVLDVWGGALKYYRAPILRGPEMLPDPARNYANYVQTMPGGGQPNLKDALDAFPGNKQSYNLWSVGPNGSDESSNDANVGTPFQNLPVGGDPADKIGDDVVNWLQR